MQPGPPTGGQLGHFALLGAQVALKWAPYKLYTFNVDTPYMNHTTLSLLNVRQCMRAGSLLCVINAI